MTQDMSWFNWMTPLMVAAGRTTAHPVHPMQFSADLAFGALADALGVGPLRELQEAGMALAKAQADQRLAQTDYFGLLSGAFTDATLGVPHRLERMRRDGDRVTSLLGLFKLWTLQCDAALHERMQSRQALEATASAVRASTRKRAELQRLIAVLSRAANIPTREEVDDGFREIQELKREVRRMKRVRKEPSDERAP